MNFIQSIFEEWKEAWVLTLAFLLLGPYAIFMMLTYPIRFVFKKIKGKK